MLPESAEEEFSMVDVRDKLCWGRSVGVYLSGGHITVTEVGTTVTGPAVIKQYHAKITDEGLGAALKQLFKQNLGLRKRQSVPVCIGLGPEQTFFMTCVSNLELNEVPSLKKLLEASGARSGLEKEEIVTDFTKISKHKLTGNQLWTLAACRRQLAEQLYTSVRELGIQSARLQPGPLSLSSPKKQLPRQCKSWKTTIRVYLNATGGLAVLMIEGRTVLWREFAYTAEQRLKILISAARTLMAYATTSLSNPTIDGIILQGDNADELAKKITEEAGFQTATVQAEGFTDTLCSYGLALSAKKNDDHTGLDLFRTLRDAPTILDMFPWKHAVAVVIMVLCMGFMMWQKSADLIGKYNVLVKQNESYEWTDGMRTGEISNERKLLLSEVQAVSKFISTRIIWSDYLSDLPTRLPTNACLSNIWAVNELKEMSKKKQGRRVKKSLTMRGVTKFGSGVVAPQEIESFLESLRNVDLLERDFPQIQLAEIKWRREGESEIAMFTVIALPKEKE